MSDVTRCSWIDLTVHVQFIELFVGNRNVLRRRRLTRSKMIDNRSMVSSTVCLLDSHKVNSHKPSLDLSKDDLYGDLSWMRDNDYVTRGYRACLSFYNVLAR